MANYIPLGDGRLLAVTPEMEERFNTAMKQLMVLCEVEEVPNLVQSRKGEIQRLSVSSYREDYGNSTEQLVAIFASDCPVISMSPEVAVIIGQHLTSIGLGLVQRCNLTGKII